MRHAAAAIAVVMLAGVAAARSVDYSVDDTSMRAAASRLGIEPVSPLPDRGPDDVALVVSPAADHETLRLGMACSAFKVLNPVSALLPRIAAAWDRDGRVAIEAGAAPVTLRVDAARSYRRCVLVSETSVRCITKVAMNGAVETGGRSAAIAGEAERDAAVGGFCGDLALGIGIVGREAAIALIGDARAKLAALGAE